MNASSSFGIGAQVFVRDASATDLSAWPAEPSGIIVRSGGSALQGVWGSTVGGRVWVVEFDDPQTNADGESGITTAQVHEKFLELAPPIDSHDVAENR